MTHHGSTWPTEIRLGKERNVLHVSFDDGAAFAISAELLRVSSPSAEVQGHSPEQRITVPGKRTVGIREIRPIGNYAVQLVFTDGHDTGYYRYEQLRELGERQEELFAAYLAELAAKGLDRG
jgi:DUF971 family protein